VLSELDSSAVQTTFGIVIETEVESSGISGRIKVQCIDGSQLNQVFKTDWDLSKLIGNLIVIFNKDGAIKLSRFTVSSISGLLFKQKLEPGTKMLFDGKQFVFTGKNWCSYPSYSVVPTGLHQELEIESALLLENKP